ncbi:hypothetical protein BJP25_12145 [Actinokineospora bangkokensis]|uniref:DUF5753 domain-containing protein n=1 Tax=Actinokineospora bangkokensis TaxID=1193682 RepID=A0A1Q9LR73_9PSEU|nr:hypothetical protein BJP25_12145 [Actinokineospora bangkokensis]
MMGVSLRRVAVGALMTRARVAAGMTTRGAAARVGMLVASLNRSENGKRLLTDAEVGALLTVYRADRATCARVARVLDESASPWWSMGNPADHTAVLAHLDQRAEHTLHLAAAVIPVPWRTPAYTRELHSQHLHLLPGALESVRERAAAVGSDGGSQTVVINEAVLADPVESSAVLAEQLRALLSAIGERQLTVRVAVTACPVPFATGLALFTLSGAVFAHCHDQYFSTLFDDPEHLDRIQDQIAGVLSTAHNPIASTHLIDHWAKSHADT